MRISHWAQNLARIKRDASRWSAYVGVLRSVLDRRTGELANQPLQDSSTRYFYWGAYYREKKPSQAKTGGTPNSTILQYLIKTWSFLSGPSRGRSKLWQWHAVPVWWRSTLITTPCITSSCRAIAIYFWPASLWITVAARVSTKINWSIYVYQAYSLSISCGRAAKCRARFIWTAP